MFETKKQYAHCIFCGSEDLSAEHMFGKSFAREMGVEDMCQVPVGSILDGTTKKGSSPILHFAPKLLCKECNSARLGPGMEAALPMLLSLCNGKEAVINDAARKHLLRYFERLGLIVDVHASSEQVAERRKQSGEYLQNAAFRTGSAYYSQDERSEWLEGKPLSTLTVCVGHYLGKHGVNPDFNIYHVRLKAQNPNTGEVVVGPTLRRVSMLIRQLAVCIDIGPMEVVGVAFPTALAPGLMRLESLATWPTKPTVTDDDYLELRKQDENTRLIRKMLAQQR